MSYLNLISFGTNVPYFVQVGLLDEVTAFMSKSRRTWLCHLMSN
jgi:hypothetical protein